MKTAVLAATVVSLSAASLTPTFAGDREWATAGKVLTGVFAAGVIADAFRPHYEPAVVYQAPPPTVVYAPAPAQVVVAPPQPQTVVYYSAPPPQVVYVAAPRVVYAPAPCYRPFYGHAHFGRRW